MCTRSDDATRMQPATFQPTSNVNVSRLDGHQVFVEVKTNKAIDSQILEQELRSINFGKGTAERTKNAYTYCGKYRRSKHLWSDGENSRVIQTQQMI